MANCKICEKNDGKTVKATYKATDKTFKKLTPYLCTEHVLEITDSKPLLFFEKIEVENVEGEKAVVEVEKLKIKKDSEKKYKTHERSRLIDIKNDDGYCVATFYKSNYDNAKELAEKVCNYLNGNIKASF